MSSALPHCHSFKIMHLASLRLSRRVDTSCSHCWCLASSPLTHAFLHEGSHLDSSSVLFSSISLPAKELAEFYQSFPRDGKPTQHLVQQILSTVERHSGLPGCPEPPFLLPPPLRIPIDFLIGLCCHHAAQPHSLLCVPSEVHFSVLHRKRGSRFSCRVVRFIFSQPTCPSKCLAKQERKADDFLA